MPLRLKTQPAEDRDSLKELQKALKQGNVATVLERHTDSTLIQLLRRLQQPGDIVFWISLVVIGMMAIALLGMALRVWRLTPAPIVFFSFIFHTGRFFRIKPEVLETVKPRLEQASLPTLLDAFALKIRGLDDTISKALTKRLAMADTEELETLSSAQRKQLLRFTLAQVRLDMTNYHIGTPYFLPEESAQAATVGFLALASLRQPGAERISPQRVHTTSANLKRAIEEYQLAMKVAG